MAAALYVTNAKAVNKLFSQISSKLPERTFKGKTLTLRIEHRLSIPEGDKFKSF